MENVSSMLNTEIHVKDVRAVIGVWCVIRVDGVVNVLSISLVKVVQMRADIREVHVYVAHKNLVPDFKSVIQVGNYYATVYHVAETLLPLGVTKVIVLLAGNETVEKDH